MPTLREAAAELLALKALKDRFSKPSIADLDSGALPTMRRDYERRKPPAWDALRSALTEEQAAPVGASEPALQRFNDNGATDDLSPVERLRFFCSLAMNGQDWLDVEPFFDALAAPPAPQQAHDAAGLPGAQQVEPATQQATKKPSIDAVSGPTIKAQQATHLIPAQAAPVAAVGEAMFTRPADTDGDIAVRAVEMLTAYAELVKMTGKYSESHYIPEIEFVIGELRDAQHVAARGEKP